jgi:hypothetical protein
LIQGLRPAAPLPALLPVRALQESVTKVHCPAKQYTGPVPIPKVSHVVSDGAMHIVLVVFGQSHCSLLSFMPSPQTAGVCPSSGFAIICPGGAAGAPSAQAARMKEAQNAGTNQPNRDDIFSALRARV